MRFRSFFGAAVFALAFVPAVSAHDYSKGKMVVDHPWARATIGTARPGVVYLALINEGKVADKLLSAATPVAARVEIHRSFMEGNVMRMAPVDGVEVAAGRTVEFAPGGLHLMLMGLNKELAAGDRVSLTLVFEKAGRIQAKVTVMPMGAGAHGGGMKH